MSAVVAGFVAAAFLILFAAFYVVVRRVERDVDYADMRGGRRDVRIGLVARLIANVIVASP